MVKLVANMHGNEVVGREMLLKLASLLLTRSQEPHLERILDSIDLHILVSLNPDGFEKRDGKCHEPNTGRNNTNNVITYPYHKTSLI